MEKETTIKIPEAYLPLMEDIRLLQSDQNNPNMTTLRQQEQIWASLQKYGWAYPILTNNDGTYVDGEPVVMFAWSTVSFTLLFCDCPLMMLTEEC